MRRQLTITDLTRMSGAKVCLAGYTADKSCVRPLFRNDDVTEPWLFRGGRVLIQPFAVVELELEHARPHPPHVEDWLVTPRHRRLVRECAPEERLALLNELDDGSVEAIFGAPLNLDPGWHVALGTGTRSLGTLRADRVLHVHYDRRPSREDRYDYRLSFADGSGETFNLPVTDLGFQHHLTWLRSQHALPPTVAADQVLHKIQQAAHVYLRLGLTRGTWHVHPNKCFVQVTGIYSFPDYLDGRCFADFDPSGGRRPEIELSAVPF